MILIIYGQSISYNLTLMLHTSKTCELSEDCEKLRPKHVAAIINKLVLNIM
jgi:hypothetical protein